MVNELQFIETDVKLYTICQWCGRKKFRENEKFYKVFIDNQPILTICEICKYGHHIARKLGHEKTFESHFVFFLKQKISEFGNALPNKINEELNSALNNFVEGKYSESFRNIGLIAEWVTEKIFVMEFGEEEIKKIGNWDNMLGRLQSKTRENEEVPEETLVLQLASLKWLRNKASHPSDYEIDEEDVMLGLMSIVYSLYQARLYDLF